jgi:hypothetical protein
MSFAMSERDDGFAGELDVAGLVLEEHRRDFEHVLTRCFDRAVTAAPGSKDRCSTTSPPFCSVTRVHTFRPPM